MRKKEKVNTFFTFYVKMEKVNEIDLKIVQVRCGRI